MLSETLSYFSKRIQKELFPLLEGEFDEPLLKSHRQVAQALEVIQIEKFIYSKLPFTRGRPSKNHTAIARAFIAKHVLGLVTTEHLVERLKCDKHLRYICGWLPGEKVASTSTFSRVFASISASNILDEIHGKLVREVYKEHVILHSGRDSVPIPVRERKKEKVVKKERYSQVSAKGKKLSVCEYQAQEAKSLEEMAHPLPLNCDIGKKTDAKGISKCWRGYKLHVDVAEGSLPISCILTSASTHDSQAAIPLSKKSAERADILYELMDSAYDVNAIKSYIESQNRKPLIKQHKRKGKRKELIEKNELAYQALKWIPADIKRLKHRFCNERIFARLHDRFLCQQIWVKGEQKVRGHVMLSILAIFASEFLRLLE